ncbi:unknown [Candidatus Apopatosoma intestinale]|nr:unknown [Candidatus Apopatosoma intestinale]
MRMCDEHFYRIADIIAVFFHERTELIFIEISVVVFVLRIFLDVQGNIRADTGFFGFFYRIALGAGGFPFPCLILAVCTGDDGHLVGYHEGGVETNAELTYDIERIAFVFRFEVKRTAPCDSTEIVFQLVARHADTVIGNGERSCRAVGSERYCKIALGYTDTLIRQGFEMKLVYSVGSIADKLAQENLLICIDGIYHQFEKLFALGFKFFYCHDYVTSFQKNFLYNIL